jgi:hypothetical protein
MPEIRRGLRIDDDDVPEKYVQVSIDANRPKTKFEDDVDALLFPPGGKAISRRTPATKT